MLILSLTALALIAVIWLGYPLVIRAIGALAPITRRDSAATLPTVSVVLASRDDVDSVRARVTDLLQAEYPPELLQIVVARDAARPIREMEPPDAFGPPQFVTFVEGDTPGGKASALNAGVRAATNEILVFADTAQRFDPGAIQALVSQLSGPEVGAVSGMLELNGAHGSLNLAERYWRYERWLRRWEARVHSCVGVTGAIYAMPRRLWEPLPANLILDDVYVPMRLVLQGWRVEFTPRALARDVRRFAPAQEYRRKVRTLTGVIQVCAWLPGVLNPFRNPVWLQFVFHKVLRLLTPYLATLAVLGIAWTLVSMLLSWPGGLQTILGTAVVAGALCLIPRVRSVVRRQLAWGFALQSSIVVATLNGARGRWDVWR